MANAIKYASIRYAQFSAVNLGLEVILQIRLRNNPQNEYNSSCGAKHGIPAAVTTGWVKSKKLSDQSIFLRRGLRKKR